MRGVGEEEGVIGNERGMLVEERPADRAGTKEEAEAEVVEAGEAKEGAEAKVVDEEADVKTIDHEETTEQEQVYQQDLSRCNIGSLRLPLRLSSRATSRNSPNNLIPASHSCRSNHNNNSTPNSIRSNSNNILNSSNSLSSRNNRTHRKGSPDTPNLSHSRATSSNSTSSIPTMTNRDHTISSPRILITHNSNPQVTLLVESPSTLASLHSGTARVDQGWDLPSDSFGRTSIAKCDQTIDILCTI